MDIRRHDTPAEALGERISQSIAEHDGDVLCFLAGGSSIDVFEHIQLPFNRERRTIFIMGDERVSREPHINNYLQLKERFADRDLMQHVLETVPHENETHMAFTQRIKQLLSDTLGELQHIKVICILGVGGDGHTAGIMPMDREAFQETYPDDAMYVKVRVPNDPTCTQRTTLTPDWILEHAHELYMYVIGEEKAHILYMLIGEQRSLFERPAEIVKQHRKAEIYTDQEI